MNDAQTPAAPDHSAASAGPAAGLPARACPTAALVQASTAAPTQTISATPSPTIDATQGFFQTLTARPTRTKVNTYTPKPTRTATVTLQHSLTPVLMTDPFYGNPITPTFTPYPTLDSIKNKTATPAPANICIPQSSEEAPVPDFMTKNWDIGKEIPEETILEYFNLYGGEHFKSLLAPGKYFEGYTGVHAIQDFTNDGQPEYAIDVGYLYIIGCVDGEYKVLFKDYDDIWGGYAAEITNIFDGNRNGIPELLIYLKSGTVASRIFRLIEWVDGQFVDIIDPALQGILPDQSWIWILPEGQIYYEDIDNDFIDELVVEYGEGVGFYIADNFPWRYQTKYYKWDGRFYMYLKTEYSEPEYWHQAVNDGDRFTLCGEYDRALEAYQKAIFKVDLDGMSFERKMYFINNGFSTEGAGYPSVDPDQHPTLAAYSRFRIMLLYVLQGWMQDAEVVYDTLLEMYPEGEAGHEFALAAELFWEEYQQSNDIAVSCDQVIALAKTFDESIFDFFGGFSIEFDEYYYPEDICPFGTAAGEGE